jgi:YD repeat-containing protein
VTIISNYDGGLLWRKIDRMGRVIEYDYDQFARQTEEDWIDTSNNNAVVYTIAYAYDQLGRVTSAGDSDVFYGYEYDNTGRVVNDLWDSFNIASCARDAPIASNRGHPAVADAERRSECVPTQSVGTREKRHVRGT